MSLPLPEVPDEPALPEPVAQAPEPEPELVALPSRPVEQPAAAQAMPPAGAKSGTMPRPKRTPRSTADQRPTTVVPAVPAAEPGPARQQQPETPAARNGSAPLPTRPTRPAAARSNEWTSPGDEGWQAAESLLNQGPGRRNQRRPAETGSEGASHPGFGRTEEPGRDAHQESGRTTVG